MITGIFYKIGVLFLGLFDWLPTWNLPSLFYAGLDTWIGYMMKLNQIFPVWHLFKAFLAVLSYFIIIRTWNLFSDFVALLRGSGNPKL